MPEGDHCDIVNLRTCLVFWEAVTWIARRDFSLPANRIGPRQLCVLPQWGDEEDEDDNGRYELAHELLMDRAARGKIRLYARGGSTDLDDEKSLSFPMELSPEYIKKAEYQWDETVGPTLCIPEIGGYEDIVVDYSDLIREFWGESGRECDKAISKQPTPATPARPNRAASINLARRRGRPARYPMQDFVAEMTRYCLTNALPDQAALERHMAEWSLDQWGGEPTASYIREWVSPTFRAVRKALSGTGNSRPDLPADGS
jgi:hypothetical protein